MKNITFKLGLFALLSSIVVACTTDDTTSSGGSDSNLSTYETFLADTNVSVWVDGESVKSYDQSVDQIIYNDSKTIFLLTDVTYSSQITLTLSGSCTLDTTVTVNYSSNLSDAISSGSAKMTVVKVDESDSRYWLWNSDSNIGFIIDLDF